ncbi:MAG: trypsin-like peptidase domain-containing protein [Roseovarius sp.]
MRARIWIAVALALGLAAPAGAGSSLIRLTDREDLFGWEAVGRIDIGTGSFCTGALIAPDLVLTAAHCVYDRANRPVAPAAITFSAGLRDGAFISQSGVAQVAAHPGYVPGYALSAEMIRHDTALLRLAAPIPSAVAAPFVLAGEGRAGQEVSVVSYGRGREAALSWQRACGVTAAGRGLLALDCDVTFGSSGAPVFTSAYGRARIVSVISSGGTSGGAPIAYGMALPDIVEGLKAQVRREAGPAVASPRRVKVGQGGGASGAKFAKP